MDKVKNPLPSDDTPCPRCGGKGYIEVENAHEMEVWACPECGDGTVGEIL